MDNSTSLNTKKSCCNIVMLDDHYLIIAGLSKALNESHDFCFVGGYTSSEELYKHLENGGEQIDILLLDIDLPGEDVESIIMDSHILFPNLKILLFSATENPYTVEQLLKLGIQGFLSKHACNEELLTALNLVFSGSMYFESSMSSKIIHHNLDRFSEDNPANLLSDREVEVLKLVSDGMTNIEIAQKLYLSPRTVGTHRYNINKKLKVKNIAGAIKLAVKHQVI